MNKNNNLITSVLSVVLIVAALAVLGMQLLEKLDKYNQITAFDRCSQNAIRSYQEGEKASTEIDKAFYNSCLEDLGYSSSYK